MFTKMYFSREIQRRAKRDGRNPATGARMRRSKRDGRNPSTGA
jgi:nucleoid DNA-binding protein